MAFAANGKRTYGNAVRDISGGQQFKPDASSYTGGVTVTNRHSTKVVIRAGEAYGAPGARRVSHMPSFEARAAEHAKQVAIYNALVQREAEKHTVI